ncbi:MAG: hypothetical protein IPK93_02000 [Solirubrobacterales bacterium]|nr:hypothetical protein [Solirubrobacterales bacterium]
MNEDLTPKELARIKREARAKRIGNIRRRVLVLGATLAAVFSGVALVRTEINQPAAGSATRSTLAQSAPVQSGDGESDDSKSDEGGAIGGAIVGVVNSVLGDSSGDGSSATTSTSSPAPAPQPAAPLTTSQS